MFNSSLDQENLLTAFEEPGGLRRSRPPSPPEYYELAPGGGWRDRLVTGDHYISQDNTPVRTVTPKQPTDPKWAGVPKAGEHDLVAARDGLGLEEFLDAIGVTLDDTARRPARAVQEAPPVPEKTTTSVAGVLLSGLGMMLVIGLGVAIWLVVSNQPGERIAGPNGETATSLIPKAEAGAANPNNTTAATSAQGFQTGGAVRFSQLATSDRGGTLLQAELDHLNATTPIIFEPGSSQPSELDLRILNQIVSALNGYPTMNIVIVGYTSDIGDIVGNQHLSAARAANVKTYLISQGVAETRLLTTERSILDPAGTGILVGPEDGIGFEVMPTVGIN